MLHLSRRMSSRFVMLAAAGVFLVLSVGCSSTSLYSLRSNPSPELATPGWREGEVKNEVAITNDAALRSAYLDWMRFWLVVDRRPSSVIPLP
ncbi:MAG: hypothetical protein ACOC3G_07890 [Phycisphaeraceae bacterium]